MLNLALFTGLLLISFYFLIKSSDYLITSASILGKKAGFSKFIIGLTIIAVGTSLPELASALMGVFTTNNPAPFVLGTVLGSNISNVLLVFSILLIFSNNFKSDIKQRDIFTLSISTLMLALIVFIGQLSILFGIIFITLFIVHLLIVSKKTHKKEFIEEATEEEQKANQLSVSFLIWIFILALVVLNIAAKGVIYSIENIGVLLEIPIAYLTLTTVALATSLPEAVVTYTSAKKREFNLAVGNIVGSNISNILLIVGVSSLFKVIEFNPLTYLFSIIIVLISTMYLILIIKKEKVQPWYGIVSLFAYIIYIIIIFIS